MTDTLLALLLATVVLLAAGGPLAVALTRSVPVGLVLAPVTAGLVLTAAAGVAILTRTPLLPWVLFAMAIAAHVAYRTWRGGRRDEPSEPIIDLDIRPLALLIILACTLPALIYVFRAPVGWDARTIWWFHAEWIEEGGQGFNRAMGDEAVNWSHADYPPYSSAAVAAVRTLTPESDTSRAAQATSALLSWSALALLGIALASTVAAAMRRRAAALDGAVCGALVLAYGGFVVDDRGITSGYVDYLWALLLATAAVALLVDRPRRSSFFLGALAVVAAALTKNEGLVCAVVLAALVLLRHRHRWRDALIVGVALLPGVAWALYVRILGAQSDLGEDGNVGGLLAGDRDVWSRLRPTVDAIVDLDYTLPFLVIAIMAVAVAVLGAIGLTGERRQRELGSDLWLWALAAGVLGAIVVAFLVSPADIGWHLDTALNRTMLAPTAILLVSLATWLRLALDVVLPSPPGPQEKDQQENEHEDERSDRQAANP